MNFKILYLNNKILLSKKVADSMGRDPSVLEKKEIILKT